ncbi:MAG: von Willebrand factor type A domain-containing protein [Oscillospiraceae bacterium]|nr:von Willebrand factor type A domain-containing protein [Oscillospiraceae bacterium]MDD4413044.1 von Willebrand factor type A domain-containing protein [Oscillospiraceae bacterium]
MDFNNFKKYIDEKKSLEVTPELKEKTISAAEKYDEIPIEQKKTPYIKFSKIKRFSAIAAGFFVVASVILGIYFFGIPGLTNNSSEHVMNSGTKSRPDYVDSEGDFGNNLVDINEDEATQFAEATQGTQNNSIGKSEKAGNTNINMAKPTQNKGLATPGKTPDRPMPPQEEGFSENPFIKTKDNAISTFSIDVDTASYVNFRSYISQMTLKEFQQSGYTIRIEEAINYFDYDYVKPSGDVPVAVTTSVGNCSWNKNAKLASITVAGRDLTAAEKRGSNIVFLIDISGSMSSENKLPLLKKSLINAIENLDNNDTVSIVTYASGVKTALAGAKGSEKVKIINTLNSLKASGSTAGADGLNVAYSVAQDYFIKGGNNRIILATDGDFNVGPSSLDEMKKLVTEKRESGIYITVLGFGVNYYSGDGRLETIADNGNGGYYVIDCLEEGEKVLCDQFTSVLFTIAKDVKLQVEFNPESVESYRLIGYENRVLSNEDFENDKVDAGDLGAGQTVTALYEIVLKNPGAQNLFKVKIRYKNPGSDVSKLYEHTAQISQMLSDDFYFVSAVAEACLVINDSKYKGTASIAHAYETAYEHGNNPDDSSRLGFIKILKNLK